MLERLLAANAKVEAKDNRGLGEPSWVELEWKSGVNTRGLLRWFLMDSTNLWNAERETFQLEKLTQQSKARKPTGRKNVLGML